jgi:ketosteroid isomerase-like protein
MSDLSLHVGEFIRLCEQGQTAAAMERFYASDVVVFENRELARAGRAQCVEFERNAIARLVEPPKMKALAHAVNHEEGEVFIEWVIRVTPVGGEPHRIEEVVAQVWDGNQIVKERHYYEGYVDEGWEEEELGSGS